MTSSIQTETAGLEATFWEQRWPVEARLARWASWIAIGLGIVGLFVDCRMVGLGSTFWALGTLRLVSILGFVAVLVLAGRDRRSQTIGLASVIGFMGLSVLQAAMPVLKPTAAGIQGASQLVIFVLWCLFYPGRVRSKVIAGLVGWAAWAGVAIHQHIYAGYSHLTDFYTVLPGQLAACVLAPLAVRYVEQMQLRESLSSQRQLLLNRQLEREVKMRARREEELSEATLAAQEASRAKSVFLARMSHELRTPLGGVLGAAGAFDEADLSAEHRALLGMMRSSGEVLRTLVDEVLDLERVETGKLELKPEPVDVRRVVDQAVDVCSLSAYAKGLDIVGIVDVGVPARVRTDSDRLGQVLVNLLGNGVKFTDKGEVRVEVRQVDESGGRVLELCVLDTGRGIPPDRLEAVFEPYDQGDPDMERRFGGSGLGLAISRRIVEAMEGEIRVESELDQGSVFTVSLPAPAAELGAGESADYLSCAGVVVVSAKESTRRAVTAAGEFHGVRVVTAPSVEKGLVLWRAEGAVAPMVVDGEDLGASAGARLAQGLGKAAPLILAVRPLDLTAVRQSGVGAHFSAITTKPLTLRRIHQALEELAQGRPAVAASEERALRVLVVDDDLVSRKIARSLIRRLGHEVDVAPDGTSALEAAGVHAYDVYVIDLHMPDMMGSDLARVLRERLGDGPYLLALTAAARQEDRQRCLDAGMDAFLTKPVDVSSLRTAFEAIVRRRFSQ
jgi:signal transduction histidine kinase/CheY-like chemotaxis protein